MKRKKGNRFWDSLANRYDEFIDKYAKQTYQESFRLMKLHLSKESRVLEIGTGTGLVAFTIANEVKHITAIDYSEEMIRVANNKLKESELNNIEFKLSPATGIHYPDQSFDLVIASNIFHLLPEPEKVLSEISRLIVPKGKVILPTFCHGQNLKTKLMSSLMNLSGFKAENKWSAKQFRQFLQNQGFKVDEESIIKDRIPLSFIVVSK